MTGRGAGYCAGHDEPGFSNPLPRGGRGGFGRGGGWGRGRGFAGGPQPHQAGVPCFRLICPTCGEPLTRRD